MTIAMIRCDNSEYVNALLRADIPEPQHRYQTEFNAAGPLVRLDIVQAQLIVCIRNADTCCGATEAIGIWSANCQTPLVSCEYCMQMYLLCALCL
jgi:hypothetical protein